jgi:hypothetical protein
VAACPDAKLGYDLQRGRVVIKRNETGKPMEIGWYINGSEAESIPLDCDEELAKEIGTQIVDQRIPVDEEWQQAEKRIANPTLVDVFHVDLPSISVWNTGPYFVTFTSLPQHPS